MKPKPRKHPGGRPPLGERAMTPAEKSARTHAKNNPGTAAYASALINDYESLVGALLQIASVHPGADVDEEATALSVRAEARRRHFVETRGKPYLANPDLKSQA